ncbi:MAG: SpoIIE family protein phosphatase, partial [Bacteroidales bacterium]|nr:SpoIIE family protein phosphatase [Bacteroidales bacterium]
IDLKNRTAIKTNLNYEHIGFNNVISTKNIDIQDKPITFIGTWHHGVIICEGPKNLSDIKSMVHLKNGFGYYIPDFLKDHKGNVWVGSTHHISVIKFDSLDHTPLTKDQVKRIPIHGLKIKEEAKARCLYLYNNKEVWIGTLHGLIKVHSYDSIHKPIKDFSHYTSKSKGHNKLLCNGIECIFEDSKNNIWLGTFGGGLALYHPKADSFSYFTQENGLRAENIYSIVEQKDKHVLWLGTNKGIVRFDPSQKEAGRFKDFTVEDGLQGMVFHNNAAWVNSRGEITFGGPNGINRFHPNKMTFDTTPPSSIITGITVYNRSYKEGEYPVHTGSLTKINGVPHLKLNYRNYAFKISFTATTYSNPNKNQYSFKLEGYDTKWRHVDAMHRFSDYSNLPSGKYTYYLKASNSDGVWSNDEPKLIVELIPPIWERIWFRILVILLILFIAFFVYRIRVRALKERQKHLERVVDERTRDLQNANESLHMQKEEILSQNEEIQQQRDAIAEQKGQIELSLGRLEVLSRFGQELTATLNIEHINDMMYQYVKSIVNIHAFGIGLVKDDKSLVFTHFVDNGNVLDPFEKSLTDENSLTAWCVNNQKPILINNLEEEYSNYVPSLNKVNTAQTTNSRIHIPLTVKDKRIGLLVINSLEINTYSKDDFTNMQTLASYIAIALDNAKAYDLINSKNLAIKESITYAQSIQSAFMPTDDLLSKYLDCFVIFKPKDIVSGDFTWFSAVETDEQKPLKAFVCVADCTGHGVPGALVSMVGNNLLNEHINIRQERNPAIILDKVNQGFQKALKQDVTRNNDGMDMALVIIEAGSNNQLDNVQSKYKLTFSGAKNPCVIYRAETGELEILKGSRKSIGGLRAKNSKQNYEKLEATIYKNDVIYLFTDGIIDQHNSSRDRFTRQRFFDTLTKSGSLKTKEQKEIIEKALNDHMNGEKQTDDISVMGIKL